MLRETFLFWRISKGGPGLPEEGGPWDTAMPAWEKILKEEDIWDVILFLYDFTGRKPRAREEGRNERRVVASALCSMARRVIVTARIGTRGGSRRRDRCAASVGQGALSQVLFAVPRRKGRRRRICGPASSPQAAQLHDRQVQGPDNSERITPDIRTRSTSSGAACPTPRCPPGRHLRPGSVGLAVLRHDVLLRLLGRREGPEACDVPKRSEIE